MTLRSGIELDTALMGRECDVKVYGGEIVRRVVIGTLEYRGSRVHVCTADSFKNWDRCDDTIPGIAFPAGDVTILPSEDEGDKCNTACMTR